MKENKETIELKMTWVGQMRSYIMFMEMGDDSNREFAKKELMKLAEKLDKLNERKQGSNDEKINDCGDAFDY